MAFYFRAMRLTSEGVTIGGSFESFERTLYYKKKKEHCNELGKDSGKDLTLKDAVDLDM